MTCAGVPACHCGGAQGGGALERAEMGSIVSGHTGGLYSASGHHGVRTVCVCVCVCVFVGLCLCA